MEHVAKNFAEARVGANIDLFETGAPSRVDKRIKRSELVQGPGEAAAARWVQCK